MASATNKKTVLITGCSKNSIGDALAQEFARRGHHVLATARSLSKISHLTSMGIETFELDISSSESIAGFRNNCKVFGVSEEPLESLAHNHMVVSDK